MSVTKILKRCGLLAATVAVVVSFSYLLKPAAVCLQRHGWMDVYPSAIEIEGFKAFVADEMTARRCLPSSEAERAKIVEVTTSSTGSAMDAPSATSADAGNEKPSPVSGVLDGGDAGKQVEPRHEASGVRTCPSLDDTTSADVKDFVLGRRSAEMEEAGWSDAIDAGQSILAYVHVCVSSVSSLASMGVECVDRIAHGTVRFASKVVNVWLEYSQPARDAETQSFQSAMEAAGPMASRTYDAILGMASDWGVWVTELQSTGVAWVRSCLFFALKGDDGAKVTAVEEKRPLWKRWKGSGIKTEDARAGSVAGSRKAAATAQKTRPSTNKVFEKGIDSNNTPRWKFWAKQPQMLPQEKNVNTPLSTRVKMWWGMPCKEYGSHMDPDGNEYLLNYGQWI